MGTKTWQQVASVLVLVFSVYGIISYSSLLGALFQLKGVTYTHSGDSVCKETCDAFINVSTSYWKVCFEHSTRNDTIYKKSALSRTLWVNLGKTKSIISTVPETQVDWLVPAVGKGNWRPLKDGDCWQVNKVNRIKLVGHKKAEDTVKWSFRTGDLVDIDPKWEGVKQDTKPSPGSVKESYTKDSKTECKGNRCNLVVSEKPVYSSDKGDTVDKESSLKGNSDFDLVTSVDKDYGVDVIDYNLTSIKLCLKASKKYLGKDVPLVVYEQGDVTDTVIHKSEIRLDKESDQYCDTFPFGIGYIVKYGFNSTKIAYNATLTTKSFLLAYNATWSTLRSSTAGYFSAISTKTTVTMSQEPVGLSRYYIYRAFLPYNTSTIPDNATITNATLCIWVSASYNFDNDGRNFITVVGNTTQSTVTALSQGDFFKCGDWNNPLKFSAPYSLNSIVNKTWNCLVFNATGIANINKYGYTKLGIREGHDIQNDAITNDKISGVYWNSSLNTGYPRLNITYTLPEPPIPPAPGNCTYSGTGNWVIPANMNCKITTAVTVASPNYIRCSGTGSVTFYAKVKSKTLYKDRLCTIYKFQNYIRDS